MKSKTSTNFFPSKKSNNLFFDKNRKSRSIYKNNRAKSFFQISKKHVQRDINKYELNPNHVDENSDYRNLGPGSYNPKYQWSVKGTKIKPDVSKSLVRKTKRK
jgi:hypothetical protein